MAFSTPHTPAPWPKSPPLSHMDLFIAFSGPLSNWNSFHWGSHSIGFLAFFTFAFDNFSFWREPMPHKWHFLCVFTWQKGGQLSVTSIIRAFIPFMKAESTWSSYIEEAERLKVLIRTHWGLDYYTGILKALKLSHNSKFWIYFFTVPFLQFKFPSSDVAANIL